MFIRRDSGDRSERFLLLKRAALLGGAVLGLIGMSADSALLIDVAIAVVLGGFLLRFLPQRPQAATDADEPSLGGKAGPDSEARR